MAGQPKAIIDWKKVDDLLVSGCSGREIASYLGIYHGTLYDRCLSDNGIAFAEYSQQKSAKGEAILRAHQFAKALGKTTEGDNTLLIWLGKQRLGQKENVDIQTAPNDKSINELISGIKEIDLQVIKEKLNAIELKTNSKL